MRIQHPASQSLPSLQFTFKLTHSFICHPLRSELSGEQALPGLQFYFLHNHPTQILVKKNSADWPKSLILQVGLRRLEKEEQTV